MYGLLGAAKATSGTLAPRVDTSRMLSWDSIVKLYGRNIDGETSKILDNADFGYTRVTVERPLRLRYQMTTEDTARFLECLPSFAR